MSARAFAEAAVADTIELTPTVPRLPDVFYDLVEALCSGTNQCKRFRKHTPLLTR